MMTYIFQQVWKEDVENWKISNYSCFPMENSTKYAPTRLDQMRKELSLAFESYRNATGFPETFCGYVAVDDLKFFKKLHERDFRVGSFDKALGRLSAVWPADVEWPADIQRPAPIEPGQAVRDKIAARTEKETADG